MKYDIQAWGAIHLPLKSVTGGSCFDCVLNYHLKKTLHETPIFLPPTHSCTIVVNIFTPLSQSFHIFSIDIVHDFEIYTENNDFQQLLDSMGYLPLAATELAQRHSYS